MEILARVNVTITINIYSGTRDLVARASESESRASRVIFLRKAIELVQGSRAHNENFRRTMLRFSMQHTVTHPILDSHVTRHRREFALGAPTLWARIHWHKFQRNLKAETHRGILATVNAGPLTSCD